MTVARARAACVALLLIGFLLWFSSAGARAADDAPPETSVWRGSWSRRGSTYAYALEMTLRRGSGGAIEGTVVWTLRASPREDERVKVGLQGTEWVRGALEHPGLLVLEGYRKDDPNHLIGMDRYRLLLASRGDALVGVTATPNLVDGVSRDEWAGRLEAERVSGSLRLPTPSPKMLAGQPSAPPSGKAAEGRPGTPAAPPGLEVGLDALLGLWGGASREGFISDEKALGLLVIGVERDASGTWRAGVRLERTLGTGGKEQEIELKGVYEGGRATGAQVEFAGTKLERKTLLAGTKGEFDAGPLTLSVGVGGRIVATFAGKGGFTATLAAREDEASPTMPSLPESFAGSWGGDMKKSDVGAGVTLDRMFVDLSRAPGGAWTAKIRMYLTAPMGGGTPVVIDVAPPPGRFDGETLQFEKSPWHRTIPSTGQKDDLEGNRIVFRIAPDGRLKGIFEGDDGMRFTLGRR